MKALLIASLIALSPLAKAETETLNVKGMHCGGCAKAIEDTVCKIEGLKSCSVKLTNAKKQEGQILIEKADGQPVNKDEVIKALQQAGDYTLIPKKESKKK